MQSIFNRQGNGLAQQFQQFKREIAGKDPNALLNNLLRSGRFSQADVDRARQMADMFKDILR